MATHSNILAWKIPWMNKPGGLQLWGHKQSDTEHARTFFLVFHFCVILQKHQFAKNQKFEKLGSDFCFLPD